jgi:hypothetical protein
VKSYKDLLLISATRNAQAVFVPITDDLCDANTCLATTGSSRQDAVVFDTDHFTAHGSNLMTRQIWPSIMGASSSVMQRGD